MCKHFPLHHGSASSGLLKCLAGSGSPLLFHHDEHARTRPTERQWLKSKSEIAGSPVQGRVPLQHAPVPLFILRGSSRNKKNPPLPNQAELLTPLAPAGGGRYGCRAPCPRMIGSRMDLASPSRGRGLAAFNCSLCLQTHLAFGRKSM